MARSLYRRRRMKPNRYQRLRTHPMPPEEEAFQSSSHLTTGRSLVRFLGLGLLALGFVYLSTVALNILILGTDDVDYSKHTDTIMLLHWRPLPRRLALVSLPRDTLIQLPKRGPMKLNAVYAYGTALGNPNYALAMARACVENLLGLKVHYIIHIRYSNFIQLVDDLGGIPLYVPKRMTYMDHAGGVSIDLEPGYQLLDGRQSLNFVRFRHDREGDLGRMRRQQMFLQAFVIQLMRFSHLPRTAQAFYTFIHQVETNLTVPAAIFLALEIKGFAGQSWRQAILPGQSIYLDGHSFWKPDLPNVRRLVADLGRPAEKKAVTASTLLPESTETQAEMKSDPLEPRPAESQPQARETLSSSSIPSQAQPLVKNKPSPLATKAKLAWPAGAQPEIRVLNGCGVPGVAVRLAERLKVQKLEIKKDQITNAPSFDFAYTIIKSQPKYLPWARRIATILDLDQDRIQIVPAKIVYPTVTIVIGNDYRERLLE